MMPAADGTSRLSLPAMPAALGRPLALQPARWRWPVVLAGCLLVVLPLKAAATDPDPGSDGRQCAVVELYVREGHQRDTEAIALLHQFAARRTGIEPVIHTITATETARSRFEQITGAFGHNAEETPLGYVAGRAAVGDTNDDLLVAVEACLQIEVFTRRGCSRCARVKAWLPSLLNRFPGWQLVFRDLTTDAAARQRLQELVTASHTTAASVPVIHLCRRLIIGFDTVETTGRQIEETLTTWSRPCPAADESSLRRDRTTIRLVTVRKAADPSDTQPLPLPSSNGAAAVTVDRPGSETGIDLPWVGRIEWRRLGLPLFTLLVGLIDGFNPCAMWILALLLSILVNLRDRWRMLAVAGTFVVVSGAAYFAFMAAWLNVFLLIGYLRPVQLLLGGLAVIIGSIHIKDFVAFRRGLSLSIPDATKPGLANRIRQIVTAANLPAALAGAITLAVLVNIVELLCTAGLPALYTAILTQQGLTTAAFYGYLLLYIAAYMFDDALLVAIVIITLSRRRLQETEGRWLKLLSGLVILFLGLALMLRPAWLGGLDR